MPIPKASYYRCKKCRCTVFAHTKPRSEMVSAMHTSVLSFERTRLMGWGDWEEAWATTDMGRIEALHVFCPNQIVSAVQKYINKKLSRIVKKLTTGKLASLKLDNLVEEQFKLILPQNIELKRLDLDDVPPWCPHHPDKIDFGKEVKRLQNFVRSANT